MLNLTSIVGFVLAFFQFFFLTIIQNFKKLHTNYTSYTIYSIQLPQYALPATKNQFFDENDLSLSTGDKKKKKRSTYTGG